MDNDMNHMNVITIERVKRYVLIILFQNGNQVHQTFAIFAQLSTSSENSISHCRIRSITIGLGQGRKWFTSSFIDTLPDLRRGSTPPHRRHDGLGRGGIITI